MKSVCITSFLFLVVISKTYAAPLETTDKLDCDARFNSLDDAVRSILFIFSENITELKTSEDLDKYFCG